jgi:hypothetical protein
VAVARLRRRLAGVEERLRPEGCRFCWWWRDGSVASVDPETGGILRTLRPETCPHCGRHKPILFHRGFVGIDLDLI